MFVCCSKTTRSPLWIHHSFPRANQGSEDPRSNIEAGKVFYTFLLFSNKPSFAPAHQTNKMATSGTPTPLGMISLTVEGAAGGLITDSINNISTYVNNDSTIHGEVPSVRPPPVLLYNSILVAGAFLVIIIGLTANASVLLITVVNQWRDMGRRQSSG